MAVRLSHRADRDPTVNHAGRHGFEVGSIWLNWATGAAWICVHSDSVQADWRPLAGEPLAAVARSGNYEDLEDTPTLGAAAARGIGAGREDVAAGDDPRLEGALQRENNLSDVADAGKALRALGVSATAAEVIAAETTQEMQRAMGVEPGTDILTVDQAVEYFQRRDRALDTLSQVPVQLAAAMLLASKSVEEFRRNLGVEPGVDVQKRNASLDRFATASDDVLRIIEAANLSAVREILELKDGIAFLSPDAVRAVVREEIEKVLADKEGDA